MEYKKNEKKQKQHLLWQPIVSDKVSTHRKKVCKNAVNYGKI